MKPVVGIICDYDYISEDNKVYGGYNEAISRFGGLPVLLPCNNSLDDVPQMLDLLDGILLIGGDDIDPFFFDEQPHRNLGNVNPYRDEFEIMLAKQAIEKDIPILGICRGIQIINVAMGGTLYQDIEEQLNGTLCHRQMAPKWYGIHKVSLNMQSRLSAVIGHKEIWVNSFHHQAIKDIA
ncbi:MAG TPA: gamma-glutamyl-gamma-aminobutyrate hydrolase family protein, partial [Clostridiales bacterium]|nr:gamma-glutamyl-gamma-aminobutyrate hydrolase family protein [Clostridiales bacterium]